MIYRGHEVLIRQPSRDDRGDALTTGSVVLDNQTGRNVLASGWRHRAAVRDFEFILIGREDIRSYVEWLDGLQGRFESVWFPSWQEDLKLVADLPAGGTEITIQDVGYGDLLWNKGQRRHLAFVKPDGAFDIRHVVEYGGRDGDTETLILDEPLEHEFSRHWMVCYLALGRLATDSPEISWHAPELARAGMPMLESAPVATLSGVCMEEEECVGQFLTWKGGCAYEIRVYQAYRPHPISGDEWPTAEDEMAVLYEGTSYVFTPPEAGESLFIQLQAYNAVGDLGSIWRTRIDGPDA
jgi:hypothetical protein